ncbi:Organic cation/carnitine transporter 4 [Castilleja foliolosa]|uniref:Organic cation/carnitine transporter 4 n=1 Tax=Castilleja foliolosa TaxID=1961234 RepID=A0ABD3DBW4_9LAMI
MSKNSNPVLSEPDLRSPLLELEATVPHKPEPVERLCIDDMLSKYCDEFGRWQMKHFILTSMAWALEAFHTMVVIFADQEPAWRCSGAGCSAGAKSVCEIEPGSWEWVGGPGRSTVAEFGLICSEKYKVGLVQAMFFAGCMIGAGVFGHFSDSKLGRKGSLLVVCILNAIFGCLTSLSPNYFIYALLRLLTGFSTGGVGLCAFVLATEPIGPTKRGLAGMSTFYFFSGGIAILSGISYFFTSWRALYIATSIPSILFLVLILPFVSESPRWYLIRGKTGRAMKIMREIATHNRKCLPENVMLALDEDTNNVSDKACDERDQEAVTGSLIDVLRCPLTRVRLFLAIAINFFCSIVYYGLSLNVVNLGTNLHLNVFLNSVAEMPAFLLTALLLDRFGRKPLSIGTQWFSGAFCVVGFCLKGYGVWKTVRMVCGVLGIFGMAATYNLLFIYTVELFPTVVRNAALGSATQAAQMGAILAPLIVVLGERIPFLVFGACGITGGVLAFMLPETLNRPLYDTMAGMEEGESELAQ